MRWLKVSTSLLLLVALINCTQTSNDLETAERVAEYQDDVTNDINELNSEEEIIQSDDEASMNDLESSNINDALTDLDYPQKKKRGGCADGNANRCGYFRYGKKKDFEKVILNKKNDVVDRNLQMKRDGKPCADKKGRQCGYYRYGRKKELMKKNLQQKIKRITSSSESEKGGMEKRAPPKMCAYYIGGRCASYRYGRKRGIIAEKRNSLMREIDMKRNVIKDERRRGFPEMVHDKRSAMARPPSMMRCASYRGGNCGSYRYGKKKELTQAIPR